MAYGAGANGALSARARQGLPPLPRAAYAAWIDQIPEVCVNKLRLRVMARVGVVLAVLASPGTVAADAPSPHWQVERLVPGALFKGIHGLAFAPDGMIHVGSVMGQSIYRVDPRSGESSVFVPPPAGLADDIEFAADGSMYWTGFNNGTLNVMDPDGNTRVIARGLPGLNSLALNAAGRLFATQVFADDALWEFDPAGIREPRLILRDMGGLNGFDFGPDGRLCGPLWFKRQIVCIDIDSAVIDVVAEGFRVPAAANFNSRGELFAIDNETGEIFRIDVAARSREAVARAPTNLDNLAFDAQDRLFVTNMADNAIYEVNIADGSVRTVVRSALSLPGGLAIVGNTLYVADTFSLRRVDLPGGEVHDISRSLADTGFPTAIAASEQRIATASFESGAVLLRDRAGGGVVAGWAGLAQPSAVVILDADRIAISEIGEQGGIVLLDRRDPDKREMIARGFAQPMGMARDGDGFLLSESAAGRIVRVDADGSRRTVAEGLQQPEGLAVGSDGMIYVAETGARRLLRIDPADGSSRVLAEQLPLGLPDLPAYAPGVFPTGIAVAEDGAVYLSSDIESSILRLRAPP
jgi:sugar lactone lactonase YvrE